MLRNWIKRLIAWLENLTDEGKQDMSGISSEVAAVGSEGLQAVEHLVTNAVSGVETIVRAAVTDVQSAAGVVVAEIAPIAVKDVDGVLAKIKDLLDGSQQPSAHWAEITTLAKALYSDTDAVIAKAKQLLDFSGQQVKAWDELVAFAKSLST